MSLWRKTDTLAGAPKFLSASNDAAPNNRVSNAFFVDVTEARLPANRAKGIKTPGWMIYREVGTRQFVEPLVPMKATAGVAGDLGVTGSTVTEDLTVSDS